MTTGVRTSLEGTELRVALAELAGSVLGLGGPVDDFDSSLWLLGMDSVGAVELLLGIEEQLGATLDSLDLIDNPSVDALALHIEFRDGGFATESRLTSRRSAIERMRADAILPADIVPRGALCPSAMPRTVLLTGATGFLGPYLLDALLRETPANVICLVRAGDRDPLSRITDAFRHYSLDTDALGSRVRCVAGDLESTDLALHPDHRAELSASVDAIFHAAAAVDWVRPYEALRATNVLGTRELLRIAAEGDATAFHFVSSLAVCYSTTAPHRVSEQADMLPHLEGLHLGYAQSKCVAESLVRAAAARGMPATIHRPALIFGDSRTGASSQTDLVAMLLKGCIELGAAPDLDWTMDCVSPDFAAGAIVKLAVDSSAPPGVTHLASSRARHWRECVLWMRLAGYPIRLLPYSEWAALVDGATRDGKTALAPLRSFLLGRCSDDPTLALPQLYENCRRNRALTRRTRDALVKSGLRCPPLDATLLARVFGRWVDERFIPPTSRIAKESRSAGQHTIAQGSADSAALPEIVGEALRSYHAAPELHIELLDARPFGGSEGIVSELTAWRVGRTVGLFRCRVAYRVGDTVRKRTVVVKVKAEDRQVIDIAESVARMCGERLGAAMERLNDHLGIHAGHVRELAVAAQVDPRFRRNAPRTFGIVNDAAQARWALVMEQVRHPVLMDAADDPSRWLRPHIATAIRGLASLHSVWLGRDEELRAQGWLAPVRSTARMADSRELWSALAEHAAPRYRAWGCPDLVSVQARAVERVDQWWPVLEEGPRTLIHGDANPRNLAIRRSSGSGQLRLCAYDWELSALAAPQRDLAEFLCFVLPPDVGRADVDRCVMLHHRELVNASGIAIDPDWWRAGFAAALRDLLIDRLAMYTLIQRVRPLPFLGRVLRTCETLCREYPADA